MVRTEQDPLLLQALERTEPQEADAVKLVFQALLGCGHLLADEETVTARVRQELSGLEASGEEPLFEPLSRDYGRLNLRPAMARGLRAEWIARLMLMSDQPKATRADVAALLKELNREGRLCLREDWSGRITDPHWLPNHSEAYRAAHHPAYRVIGSSPAALLPVLSAAAKAGCGRPRCLITVDGPCGSGKTTLAAGLAQVLQAPVVHTDDFVVPHSQKTPERLAQPGGNEDHERLLTEFVLPWLREGRALICRYSCREDRLLAPEPVPDAPFAILEGSYSNMPALREQAAVRVFVTAAPEKRLRRIALRDGEDALPMYRARWIPLEEAYLSAFGLPDAGCIRVDGMGPRMGGS